jgi:hypothetical protein
MEQIDIKIMAGKIAKLEQNFALFAASEKNAVEWRTKVDRAMFGENNKPGMIDDVRFMKKIFKVISWIIFGIFTPVFGLLGFLVIKVLANLDKILKLLDNLK